MRSPGLGATPCKTRPGSRQGVLGLPSVSPGAYLAATTATCSFMRLI
jgi:hypothetical protein